MCYKTKHQAPKFTKIKTANFYILLQIIFIYFNIAHINYVHRSYGQYIHIPWRAAYKSCLPTPFGSAQLVLFFLYYQEEMIISWKHKHLQNFQWKYCKTMKQHLAHKLTLTVRKINLTFNALWKVEMESSAKSCCSSA